MKKYSYYIIMLVVVVIAIFWMRLQWLECKDLGLSTIYCIQHIS